MTTKKYKNHSVVVSGEPETFSYRFSIYQDGDYKGGSGGYPTRESAMQNGEDFVDKEYQGQ